MRYEFKCAEHGPFIIQAPIKEGPKNPTCPHCGEKGVRVYEAVIDVWHTDGAHKHSYDKHGDKLERLNRSWSKATGEEPPEPAKDIKKNASELQ